MSAFRYHKNVQSKQHVGQVFMVIGKYPEIENPVVIKVETPKYITPKSSLSRSRQGIIWSANYGFRIKSLKQLT